MRISIENNLLLMLEHRIHTEEYILNIISKRTITANNNSYKITLTNKSYVYKITY